jgi:hypothetical protein
LTDASVIVNSVSAASIGEGQREVLTVIRPESIRAFGAGLE